MLNGSWSAASRLPVRIVIEFRRDEFEVLERACKGRRVNAVELVRIAALKLARDL
jgi:hypothetical protein